MRQFGVRQGGQAPSRDPQHLVTPTTSPSTPVQVNEVVTTLPCEQGDSRPCLSINLWLPTDDFWSESGSDSDDDSTDTFTPCSCPNYPRHTFGPNHWCKHYKPMFYFMPEPINFRYPPPIAKPPRRIKTPPPPLQPELKPPKLPTKTPGRKPRKPTTTSFTGLLMNRAPTSRQSTNPPTKLQYRPHTRQSFVPTIKLPSRMPSKPTLLKAANRGSTNGQQQPQVKRTTSQVTKLGRYRSQRTLFGPN